MGKLKENGISAQSYQKNTKKMVRIVYKPHMFITLEENHG